MTVLLLIVCAGVTGWLLGRRPATPTAPPSIVRHPSNRHWTPGAHLRLIHSDGSYRLYDYDGEALEHDGGGAA